ncbi:MAG: PilN domain-containing protein [Rhodanobacteraceae bacterium]
MARINLLPWRIERRKQREREFYGLLGAAAIAGIVLMFLWISWMGARIDNQDARNNYLTTEIKALDKKIEDIAKLDDQKARLLTRKRIIEQLQSNRSQTVHLFDDLVKTIPDGTRLTSMKQVDETLTLAGVAESNARVATYMRNIDKAPCMGHSELEKIENKAGDKGIEKKLPYVFSLQVKLNKPAEIGQNDKASASEDDSAIVDCGKTATTSDKAASPTDEAIKGSAMPSPPPATASPPQPPAAPGGNAVPATPPQVPARHSNPSTPPSAAPAHRGATP